MFVVEEVVILVDLVCEDVYVEVVEWGMLRDW